MITRAVSCVKQNVTPADMPLFARAKACGGIIGSEFPPGAPVSPRAVRVNHHISQGFPMLRKTIRALALCLLCAGPLGAQTEIPQDIQKGELIWRDPSCFFFVLKVDEHYALFEFLGGPSPMVGHIFEGKLTGFGSRRIENTTEGKPTMVYSEVYDLSKSQMEKKIPKFCKKRKEFEALEG
jgi:hypothetical protein